MAKTSVVNPRRGKRKKSGGRKRRRSYGAAARAPRRRRNPSPAPRRRRRSYGAAAPRRRRNPGSAVQRTYSSGGYRQSNPGHFDIDHLMETIPSATAGVLATRWALKIAGPMEEGEKKDEPGIKHALAIWLAASFGGQLIGQVMGSQAKGEFARIAALGWGGDMFLQKRFMRENKWMKSNLAGTDDIYNYSQGADLNGFQNQSALGDSFVDAVGNRYTRTAQGWALAGMGDPQFYQGEDGTLYQLGAGEYQYPQDYNAIMEDATGFGVARDPAYGNGAQLAGFQNTSALGMTRARPGSSSFGYA